MVQRNSTVSYQSGEVKIIHCFEWESNPQPSQLQSYAIPLRHDYYMIIIYFLNHIHMYRSSSADSRKWVTKVSKWERLNARFPLPTLPVMCEIQRKVKKYKYMYKIFVTLASSENYRPVINISLDKLCHSYN